MILPDEMRHDRVKNRDRLQKTERNLRQSQFRDKLRRNRGASGLSPVGSRRQTASEKLSTATNRRDARNDSTASSGFFSSRSSSLRRAWLCLPLSVRPVGRGRPSGILGPLAVPNAGVHCCARTVAGPTALDFDFNPPTETPSVLSARRKLLFIFPSPLAPGYPHFVGAYTPTAVRRAGGWVRPQNRGVSC